MEAVFGWIMEDLPGRALAGVRFEATRYAIGTLGVFITIWVLFEPLLRARKIRKPTPRRQQIKKELINSLKTICVFVALDIAIFDLAKFGIFQKYDNIGEYGVVWFLLSIPIAIILHDAYFYWAHRAMHHRKLYKIFHLTHHRSHNPTPFTAYSFAPGEAAVQFLFVPLLLLFMPLHGSALVIVLLAMIFRNASGHCGYELFPQGMTRNPILKQLTAVTHHDMHHENGRGNYGFYFSWWDRWMGTEHKDYVSRFEAITDRKRTLRPVSGQGLRKAA